MARQCPQGTICIENITMVIGIFMLIGVATIVYLRNCNTGTTLNNTISVPTSKTIPAPAITPTTWVDTNPLYSYSGGVLLDPYTPPLFSNTPFPRSIPVNVRTQGYPAEYRQVGILTRGETILPLMGKPLLANRDTWNFYTMNDKNNMIKLPVVSKGKSCTGEHGCDNIYNGDSVYVEGYNDTFTATIYDGDTLRYIPYI